MCFSATASFVTSAVLIPTGLYCVQKAYDVDKRYLGLALMPLFFGMQQTFEGKLWLAMTGTAAFSIYDMAMGFLFFADLFWPFFVPLAAFFVEEDKIKRRLFLIFSLIGFLLGVYIYFPTAAQPELLVVQFSHGSIAYRLSELYNQIIPKPVLRLVYIAVVNTPLLLSSHDNVRTLGILVLMSNFISLLLFAYAYVSVWCFFAAVISAYTLYIVNHCRYVPTVKTV